MHVFASQWHDISKDRGEAVKNRYRPVSTDKSWFSKAEWGILANELQYIYISSRPARLGDGITEVDVIPDPLWAAIQPILPEPPVSPTGRKKTGRPRDTLLDRKALAVNVCTELLAIPYNSLRISVSKAVVNMRLYEWQRATVNGVTVWEHITGIVQGHGHLGALLAALSPWRSAPSHGKPLC